MRNRILTALAVVAMSAGPAFAGCADLVAELEGVIAAPPATVSSMELNEMQQLLQVGANACEAGSEEAASAALSDALAMADS